MSHLVALSVLDFAVIGAGKAKPPPSSNPSNWRNTRKCWVSAVLDLGAPQHGFGRVNGTGSDRDARCRQHETDQGWRRWCHAAQSCALSVAERYLTLEAFHPDRLISESGVRLDRWGYGACIEAAEASHYAQHLAELDCFINVAFRKPSVCANPAAPKGSTRPKLFILGSSLASAHLAAARGYHFGFAGHFSLDLAVAAIRSYRERFVPGATANPMPFWRPM